MFIVLLFDNNDLSLMEDETLNPIPDPLGCQVPSRYWESRVDNSGVIQSVTQSTKDI